MRAGIAVDNWKLPVFREQLTAANYQYEDGGPITGDASMLMVETANMLHLKRVIERCQSLCRKAKGPLPTQETKTKEDGE